MRFRTSWATSSGVAKGRCWVLTPPKKVMCRPYSRFSASGEIGNVCSWTVSHTLTPMSIRSGKMLVTSPHEWNQTGLPAWRAISKMRAKRGFKNRRQSPGRIIIPRWVAKSSPSEKMSRLSPQASMKCRQYS